MNKTFWSSLERDYHSQAGYTIYNIYLSVLSYRSIVNDKSDEMRCSWEIGQNFSFSNFLIFLSHKPKRLDEAWTRDWGQRRQVTPFIRSPAVDGSGPLLQKKMKKKKINRIIVKVKPALVNTTWPAIFTSQIATIGLHRCTAIFTRPIATIGLHRWTAIFISSIATIGLLNWFIKINQTIIYTLIHKNRPWVNHPYLPLSC